MSPTIDRHLTFSKDYTDRDRGDLGLGRGHGDIAVYEDSDQS